MRKGVFGRQFKRDTNERKSLFKGLISSFLLREKIKTTEAKAKSIKSEVEKIITKAKKGEVVRNFLQRLVYKEVVDKLIKDIAPRFEKRQGGYTRIIKFGERTSDRAKIVVMELTERSKGAVISITNEKITENKRNVTAETQKKSESQKIVKTRKKLKLSVSK